MSRAENLIAGNWFPNGPSVADRKEMEIFRAGVGFRNSNWAPNGSGPGQEAAVEATRRSVPFGGGG